MKRDWHSWRCFSRGGSRCIAIVLLVVVFILCGIFIQQRPLMLFRRVVQNPIPKTVRILNFQSNTTFDEVIWIHFCASAADMNQIMERKGVQPGGVNIASANKPSWWKTNGIAYRASDYGREMGMYVSEDKTETYMVILLH